MRWRIRRRRRDGENSSEFRVLSSEFSDNQAVDKIFRAMLMMAAALRLTSSSLVAQLETLMRMAVLPCHSVPTHQQVTSH